MTPATDLVQCANCDGLFTTASSDDVFYHATCRCRRDEGKLVASPRTSRTEVEPSVQMNAEN